MSKEENKSSHTPKDLSTIDIANISPVKAFIQEELKSLKAIYDEKITSITSQNISNDSNLRLKESENARKELQLSIEETVKKYDQLAQTSNNTLDSLIKENKILEISNEQSANQLEESKSQISSLTNTNIELKRNLENAIKENRNK